MTQLYLSLKPKASLIFANTNRDVISAKRRLQRTKARAEAETEILKKGPAGYRIALTNQCSEMGYVEKAVPRYRYSRNRSAWKFT